MMVGLIVVIVVDCSIGELMRLTCLVEQGVMV